MPKSIEVFGVSPALVIAAAIVAGCGGEKHVPAANASRKALETALSAWRDGKAAGTLEATNPVIQAEDGEWRAKKKLSAFEIVGEEPVQTDAPRKFKVKITLEGAAPVDAVFVVFGMDPLYVYREADYQKHFSGM